VSLSLQRPFGEAKLLGAEDAAPEGASVWVYEGTLERFAGGRGGYQYRQRIAWLGEPSWGSVRDFGLWMVERLSINGHMLVGLRARPETAEPAEARLIGPEE
jgi:hypothetical protein